ncbi:hypothetical protein IAD21_02456 [Abditibacteriota bacterium]|nr:hypothetical protein IAD21_02456 [Abditibacteriota bacterium]
MMKYNFLRLILLLIFGLSLARVLPKAQAQTPTSLPTATAVPTPTLQPTPTPLPTATAVPTPTLQPTPTPAPPTGIITQITKDGVSLAIRSQPTSLATTLSVVSPELQKQLAAGDFHVGDRVSYIAESSPSNQLKKLDVVRAESTGGIWYFWGSLVFWVLVLCATPYTVHQSLIKQAEFHLSRAKSREKVVSGNAKATAQEKSNATQARSDAESALENARSSIGSLITGEDNRLSNSKFQTMLWFGATISAYTSVFLCRAFAPDWNYKGGINIPQNLLLLSGLSAFTFVAAKGITTNQLTGASKAPAESPSWRDLFTNDAGHIDLGDFQMLLITVIAVVTFLWQINDFVRVIEYHAVISLPDIDTTILSLFGLGQGAYLMKKVVSNP